MAKIKLEPVIVGSAGAKNIYIQFHANDKPVANQLWKLQHPGNELVDSWEESMISRDESGMKISTQVKTRNFFKECVFPLESEMTELEKSLIEKFGANTSSKLSPDEIHPAYYGVWQKLQTRFFSGDLWLELPEFGEETVSIGAKKKG